MATGQMSDRYLGLAVLVVTLLLTYDSAYASNTTASPVGHHACPPEWREHEGVCLYVSKDSTTQSAATQACVTKGGYLANIFSLGRNSFIQGLLSNASKPVWIGLKRNQYSSQYTWRGAGGSSHSTTAVLWSALPSASNNYQEMCVVLKADGLWRGDQRCRDYNPFVCEKTPDCAPRWTGTACSERCHCASFSCGFSDITCPYGCQPGWTGRRCQTPKERPEVIYYCQNSSETGPRLVLRVNTKGVKYADFRALDEEGQVASNCSKADFTMTSNPTAYTIKVPVPSSPVCQGYPLANTTWTYRWTFWLAEFKNVLSQHDLLFTATCDFTKAETMQLTARISSNSMTSRHVLPLAQSRESVKLLVVDPDTTSGLQPITEAIIGTRVRLAMTLDLHPGIRAKGISPKNCVVTSADGSEIYNITEFHGCATSETPVSKMTGNGTLQQTEAFSVFTFRQINELVFVCSFDFCFSNGDENCTDRCSNWNNNYRYSRRWGRRKRSLVEEEERHVTATFRVLPQELSADGLVFANSAGRQSSVAVVATVVVVVVAVLMTACGV